MWMRAFKNRAIGTVLWLFIVSMLAISLSAQTTVFTVQGVMSDSGTPANGTYDFQFKLFDVLTEGNQIGNTFTVANVQTDGGAWRANVDFGASPFSGPDRFLEISYSRAGEGNFTTITPRRLVTGIPYAIRSLNAANADVAIDAQSLGGTAASQFVQTDDPRMSDARVPLPGSADYIQNNASTTQMSADFNIGGTGTASILNAASHFSILGLRVLAAGTPGSRNLFVGGSAGLANTSGTGNTFVGSSAGILNTSGSGNAFFGADAGRNTTSGTTNSFFGERTGLANTTGLGNSFFGRDAGLRTTTGIRNTFIGVSAGSDNTTGSGNIAIGELAGRESRTGIDNIFIGRSARTLPTTVVNNSVAIGTSVTVTKSNTIVLGSTNQETQVPGRLLVGTPFSTGGPLPGRGYAETFFMTNVFQGIYTPNVLIGSYTNNPRGTVRPCVSFQSIPGLAFGATLANCVSSFSSLIEKTDVKPFTGGLEFITRLKPVAFKHKENGMNSIGLNTEDVAKVDASLILRDNGLALERVDESSLIVLLINSIKQQNAQIMAQDIQLRAQQRQIEELRTAICGAESLEGICKRNRR